MPQLDLKAIPNLQVHGAIVSKASSDNSRLSAGQSNLFSEFAFVQQNF